MARARLVGICRDDESENFQKHQLPVYVDDMRTMTVEFDDPCRGIDPSQSILCPNMTFKQFRQKAASLKPEELEAALTVDCEQFNVLLSQIVACVGCRRSVEKLYTDLASMGHLAVHPLIINRNSTLSVDHSVLLEQKLLYKLLIGDGGKVRAVLENLTKCRKNKRCSLHSLDMHVCKTKISWEELWDVMSEDCRDECCVVESESLLDMLETYLQKHKFCNECRTKVMKAFNLLIGDGDRTLEKGFNPALYQGLKYCPSEQHLHLKPSAAYLNMLIDRAEPELLGSVRERHAKTLDVAQGEVLTCLGLYMYDRLHRLAMALKTLQMTFQLLYCTGIIALHTSFQEMLELKHGLSDSLERLCAELQDSAANPAQKNFKCTNGNKKVKKKSAKSSATVNDCKELMRKSLADEQCQKCSRRKTSCNLTPSHSPLRTPIAVGRSKQARSLSPNRSCICISSVDSGEVGGNRCCDKDDHSVPCNGYVGNNSDDGACSDWDNNGIGEISSAQLNCISSAFHNDPVACSDFKPVLMQRPINDRCSDAGYCSQELSPDGGSPQNDMQRIVRNKNSGAVYSTCCDSLLKMQPVNDFCCNGNGGGSNDSPIEFDKIVNRSAISCNELNNTSSCVCGCSLMDMLENEEAEESNTGADDQSISPEEIEWFQQNQLLVTEERRALRERLVRRFEDMQARMTMAAAVGEQSRSS